MGVVRWLGALVVATSTGGCAGADGGDTGSFGPGFGGPGESTGGATTNWWTDGMPPDDRDSTGPFDPSESEGDEDPGLPPDLGACAGDGTCVIEDDTTCFQPLGVCEAGMCRFEPKPAGAGCDDADPCTQDDRCDEAGTCRGSALPCAAPHASSTCVAGQCGGLECDPGWGDCNGMRDDGCEAALDGDSNCGECGNDCSAGAHASGSCGAAGECEFSCDAGYDNCDGAWDNGCEIPVGANQCDAGGLNPNGCWTSHCGSSTNPDAVNFGTWYCFECTTCHVPSPGSCQWCSHDTGQWFPAESGCSCGGFEDVVCAG